MVQHSNFFLFHNSLFQISVARFRGYTLTAATTHTAIPRTATAIVAFIANNIILLSLWRKNVGAILIYLLILKFVDRFSIPDQQKVAGTNLVDLYLFHTNALITTLTCICQV